jgi:HTH-type transcriptional regulator/antitoxin HigA
VTYKRPVEAFPPGEFIRDELVARGWTQADLAGIVNRTVQHVNLLVTGKKAVTAQTAYELGAAFGTGPEVWMNLQTAYSLWLEDEPKDEIAERAHLFQIAPVKAMLSRGWIAPTETLADLKSELTRFYETDDLFHLPPVKIAARANVELTPEIRAAQVCWVCRVKQLAGLVQAAEFKPETLKTGISRLRKLAAWPEETRKVPRLLAELGVRFVVVEHLPRSRIDGAAFFVGEFPVIGMSLRFPRIDYFWHTLMHEVDHILHRDEMTIDVNINEKPDDPETASAEIRADHEAADMLISSAELNSFISRVGPLYSKDRINRFANKLGIHPGIIVGQLHYRREIPYSANTEMLVPVRDIVIAEALTDGWGKMVATWTGKGAT